MILHDKILEINMHEVAERQANDVFREVTGHFVDHRIDEPYDPIHCKYDSVIGIFKDLTVFFFTFTQKRLDILPVGDLLDKVFGSLLYAALEFIVEFEQFNVNAFPLDGSTNDIGRGAQGIEFCFIPFAWLAAFIKADESPPCVIYKNGHDHNRHKAEFGKQFPF